MKILQRSTYTILMVGILILLWAPAGMATILETSDTFNSTGESMTFDYFDTALGTLTAVEVDFHMDIASGDLTLTNTNGRSTGTATYGFIAELIGTGSLSPLQLTLTDSTHVAYDRLKSGRTVTFLAPYFSDSTTGSVGSADLYAYEGTGTFNLDLAANPFVSWTSGDFSYTYPDISYSGGATVRYTYNPEGGPPVPEPGTVVLLGVGLIGLAGLGRKKRASRRRGNRA